MKSFIDDNFLLQTSIARRLYSDYAAAMPIIDYHNHLSPQMIAEDYRFENLTEIWLRGDHYKWRAMRANGIDEKYITGTETNDWEKFFAWAQTVPFTMRNPLFHWTHLELKRTFGVEDLLNEETAKQIYQECSEKLRTANYSVRSLLKHFHVETLCTTDDPIDDLRFHKQLKEENFDVKVLPTFRPDKSMAVEGADQYLSYLSELEICTDMEIRTLSDLMYALEKRHDYFAQNGCRLADHGLSNFVTNDSATTQPDTVFSKIIGKKNITPAEAGSLQSEILYHCALLNHQKGWVQQFHYGALRNVNTRLLERIGADAGCDTIGDGGKSAAMAHFLNRLDRENHLAKTILYNLNPADNAMLAAMTGNFQDGTLAGKIQFGAAWWFLDQKSGIEAQIDALSNMGLLTRFVGMLTDSRSFLSFPRHEYFRRILCNILGNDIENGLLPTSELEFIGRMVQNICYCNAKNYFEF